LLTFAAFSFVALLIEGNPVSVVHLTRDEVESDLPAACMCCGEPATIFIDRTFLARDPAFRRDDVFWEIFMVRMLFALANVPRHTVRTSFCARHQNYWRRRAVLAWGGVAGLLAVSFGGLAVVIVLMAVAKFDAPWLSACVIVPTLVYVFAWGIPMKHITNATIRARLTGHDTIVLENVGGRYVSAVERWRARVASTGAIVPAAPAAHPPQTRPAPATSSVPPVAWILLSVGGALAVIGLIVAHLTAVSGDNKAAVELPAARNEELAEKDQPLPENERPDRPENAPFAVDPKLLQAGGTVYLSDLQEFAWKRGYPG
jgi:hypothetical protein